MTARDWRERAACRTAEPRLFDPLDGRELRAFGANLAAHPRIQQALTVCQNCPVRADCDRAAVVEKAQGVRGGRYRKAAA